MFHVKYVVIQQALIARNAIMDIFYYHRILACQFALMVFIPTRRQKNASFVLMNVPFALTEPQIIAQNVELPII